MKFFFSKTDNLYKIFKTIEKIPASRKVEIFIDPEHTLFENEWWGKQINETLSKKHIEATFVTKNKKNKEYYETVGLKVDFQGEQIVKKIFSIALLLKRRGWPLLKIRPYWLLLLIEKNENTICFTLFLQGRGCLPCSTTDSARKISQ